MAHRYNLHDCICTRILFMKIALSKLQVVFSGASKRSFGITVEFQSPSPPQSRSWCWRRDEEGRGCGGVDLSPKQNRKHQKLKAGHLKHDVYTAYAGSRTDRDPYILLFHGRLQSRNCTCTVPGTSGINVNKRNCYPTINK